MKLFSGTIPIDERPIKSRHSETTEQRRGRMRSRLMLADIVSSPKQADGQFFGGVKMDEFKNIRKYAEANENYKLLRSKVVDEIRKEKFVLIGVETTPEKTSFFTDGISFNFYNMGVGKAHIMATITSKVGLEIWGIAKARGNFVTQEDFAIFQELTDEEFVVLAYMKDGKSNDDIAAKKCVTPGGVRHIVSSIYKKFGLSGEKSNTVKRSKAIAMYPKILEMRGTRLKN